MIWQREGWPMGAMDFAHWDRLVAITRESLTAWEFPGRIHVRRRGKIMQLNTRA
jgi:hypothetical protein